jgi:HlyD family secretion protein
MLAERPDVLALDRQVVPDVMPHDTVALMVVRGGIAESRDVQLGAINETHVEVVNGLEENEVVVWRGAGRLASGDPVRLIDDASVSDLAQ